MKKKLLQLFLGSFGFVCGKRGREAKKIGIDDIDIDREV